MIKFFKKKSDPFKSIFNCMSKITNSLINHLSKEEYQWNERKSVKVFECLTLSKFLIDHAFLSTYAGKLEEIRISVWLELINSVFKTFFNETFQNSLNFEKYEEIIKGKLFIYNEILTEQPHPRCWQIIAGTCTEIDYYAQEDLDTLLSSSITLPMLLLEAQDCVRSLRI